MVTFFCDGFSPQYSYQHLRPGQNTNIASLTFAGDYTRTPFFATMEGAVLSGKKAADMILKSGLKNSSGNIPVIYPM